VSLAALASSTVAQAADPGFYFGATASRVEHDVEGSSGIVIFTAGLTPAPVFPPDGGFFPAPFPGGVIDPGVPIAPISGFVAPDSTEIDDVDAGFSVTVGYRINRYLAAELSYTDFGEYERIQRYSGLSDVRFELGVSGPSVSVLGSLPLSEQWELFLRGGVLFADQDVSLKVISTFSEDSSDEVFMGGAGVQWSFAPRWAARLEYQRTGDMKFGVTGENSIDQASLSVLFNL
jgi:opacity protein-like surface antigen